MLRTRNVYLLIFLLTSGCSEASDTLAVQEETRVPTSIALNVGNATLKDGETFRFTAELLDQSGRPFQSLPPGVGITWTSTAPQIATVSDGTVTAERPGSAEIVAQAGQISARATVLVTPVVAGFEKVSGNSQEASSGETLPAPLVVRVADRHGEGVEGVNVQFAVRSGGGSVSQATVASDGEGRATTT